MQKVQLTQITHDLNVGGLQRVVVDLCRNINRERYDISVVCLRDKGPFSRELEQAGIRVDLLPRERGHVDYFSFWKLAKMLRRLSPQIIHTHNTQPMIDGTLAAKLASVPVIIHTDHARDFPDKRRYMFAEWLMSHFVSRIVAVSEHTKQNLVKYERINPRSITTVLNGIDGSKFGIREDNGALRNELGIPQDSPVLGTGVRLTEQKGITYLVKAAPEIIKRLPQVRFVIAGDGPLKEDLERECKGLGVAENFKFLGARLDMNRILQLFDIYVLPSNWEGHPLVLLEAMAASKAIVATRVGGVPTAVMDGENGLLIPPHDPAALASRIIELLANPSLIKSMGEKGYQRFRRFFSVTEMVRNYEALYEEYLGKAAGLWLEHA